MWNNQMSRASSVMGTDTLYPADRINVVQKVILVEPAVFFSYLGIGIYHFTSLVSPHKETVNPVDIFFQKNWNTFFFWQSLPDRMFESFKMMPLFVLRITSKGGTDVWFTRLFQGKGSAMESQHPTIAWWQEIHTWKTKRWILYHIQTQNMFFSTFISSVCNVHVFAHHLCMVCLQCACVWMVLQRASYL